MSFDTILRISSFGTDAWNDSAEGHVCFFLPGDAGKFKKLTHIDSALSGAQLATIRTETYSTP
jgi:hypothetical protein